MIHLSLGYRSEKELASLKKQLQVEKEDKRDVVGKLKRQLDVHEEHMKKLKADLAAANRHQVFFLLIFTLHHHLCMPVMRLILLGGSMYM